MKLLCITLVIASLTAHAEWPQFRGPNRDGKAASPTSSLQQAWPANGPPLLWRYDELGEGYSSAAIADAGIFITGLERSDGYLYALDTNGNLRWKSSYGRDWERSHRGARTTPTLANGKAYVMSGYGRVVCFDAADGREIWAVDTTAVFGARNITWGITESLLVLDGHVIASPGGQKAGIVALDAQTGATVWICEDVGDQSGYCSPIVVKRGGRTIIAQLMGTVFVGVDAADGTLLWRVTRDPRPAYDIQAVSPVFDNGLFYITAGYSGARSEVFALSEDGSAVTRIRRDSDLDCHHGGLIVLNGYIYGAADGNNRNQWLCLHLRTGRIAGMIGGVGKGSVVFADGRLYTLGERGTMGLVDPDPDNFRLISSFTVPAGGRGPHWAHPSIAGSRLYIRHGSSLFAYAIGADE